MDSTIQKNVAQYLRELADKVERSSYCTVDVSDERKFTRRDIGKPWEKSFPTGEREITLKLNYIEERL